MASSFDVPRELMPLEKLFREQCHASGKDPVSIFSDFLTYVIFGLNPMAKPDPYWNYKQKDNERFYNMAMEYFSLMDKMLQVREWYDAFGDFFMAVISPSSQQYRGQFFTPHTVCDFMAGILMGEKGETCDTPTIRCGGFGKRVVVSDCAAGSSRLLLAAHAKCCRSEYPNRYFIAEDIDPICCKMSAINLCMHGCFGEVVCHDTLCHPDEVNAGYKINEMLYPIPACPSVRTTDDPSAFICTQAALSWKRRAAEVPQEVIEKEMKSSKKPVKENIPIQLELNFL